MKIKKLYNLAPWDRPEETAEVLLNALNNPTANPSDRMLAVEMAGDMTVVNDQLARTLLAMAGNSDEAEKLRARAAIALGPGLEHADIYGFDDPDDVELSEDVFNEIQATFRKIYHDAGVPKEERRRVLEASVRAPQEWHAAAVRAAFVGDDEDWRLTAVFGMRFIKGFDRQIVEALDSENPDIKYEAVLAAGNWGIKDAWPHIADLLDLENEDESLLFAAIEAAAGMDSTEAVGILEKLLDSDSEEINEAVHEALAMLGSGWFDGEYDEDDDW